MPLVETDFDLGPCNTLRLPARARLACRLQDEAEVSAFLTSLRCEPETAGLPWLVLGGGSNLVLAGDVPALVLKNELRGCAKVGEDEAGVRVRAAGGENWHDFVMWTLARGWSGLENLALIPGTVGAAPVQNIGAYGLEVMERIVSVEAVSLVDSRPRVFADRDCGFSYRDSVFKGAEAGRWLITAVEFRLPHRFEPRLSYGDVAKEAGADPTPLAIAEAVMRIRRAKLPDPALIGNAGSFFKNPVVPAATAAQLKAAHPALVQYPQPDGTVKLAAGWLIDQCGWKGRRLGAAGMYEKQALCLVNHGGATGAEVLATARAVQADVRSRFGVALEMEPVVWG